MRYVSTVLMAASTVWVGACATNERRERVDSQSTPSTMTNVRIHSAHDPGATFPQSGHFAFQQALFYPDDPGSDWKALDQRVRTAIRTSFKRKDFEYNEMSPDILVGVRIESGDTHYRHSSVSHSWQAQLQQASHNAEASVTLDILDWRTHRLIWRGIFEANALLNVNEEERDRRAVEVTDRLLASFPPN